MFSNEYLISIGNSNKTIDRMHQALSNRDVKLKRSDLKELLAGLLNFDSSNALDAKIKSHKQVIEAASIYHRNGAHRENPNIIFKRFKNAIQTHKFIEKYQGFTEIFYIQDRYTSHTGFEYDYGDFVFAKEPVDALKLLLNWEDNVTIKFIYHDKKALGNHTTQGYWQFKLVNETSLEEFGLSSIEFEVENDHLNHLDCDKLDLEYYILEALKDYDLPFALVTKERCDGYISSKMEQEFITDRRNLVKGPASYRAYIKLFIPYLSLQRMAEIEVYRVSPEYLAILKEFGANFDSPMMLISAAQEGTRENCEYLLSQGSSVDAFYRTDLSRSDRCALYEQIRCLYRSFTAEKAKAFMELVVSLGVDINYQDAKGDTPLHAAASVAHAKTYKLIKQLGGDDSILNHSNTTPAQAFELVKNKRNKKSNLH